jgi:serine protease Do
MQSICKGWPHFRAQFLPTFTFIFFLVAVCTISSSGRTEGVLNIDKQFEKVSGWIIGFSEDRGGCIAAATYEDKTTVWIGYTQPNNATFLAFTNPKWKSIESEGGYEVQIKTRNAVWNGKFYGLERDSEKGIYAIGLKDEFIDQMSVSRGVNIYLNRKLLFSPSLNGAHDALRRIVACQKTYLEASGGSGVGSNKGKSSGTGFFVTDQGHIVTNSHVVDGCSLLKVVLSGSPETTASVVAQDKINDLAVLKSKIIPPIVPALRRSARVGESVYVYGFPLSDYLATSGNFTIGSVTAISGLRDDSRILQISAPVQPGNSGGPAIDKSGNVVGVVEGKLNALLVAAQTKDIPQNINFAIKSSILINFLNSNDIVPLDKERSGELSPEAIADLAKLFTVHILCN